MRRYGTRSDSTVVPGNDSGLSLVMQPVAEACAEVVSVECEPDVTGLFWFSDSTGAFDQDVEAAYLLAEGAAGPLLGLAKLVGETCDLPVTWTKTWTPASGSGGDPGYFEDGARLVVYPLADTVPGVLEVSAEHGGQSYGPILLTVLRYSCYCYYGTTIIAYEWYPFSPTLIPTTNIGGRPNQGMRLGPNPMAVAPVDGIFYQDSLTGNFAVADGYTVPDNPRVRVSFTPNGGQPTAWDLQLAFRAGGPIYTLDSAESMPKVFTIDAVPSRVWGNFPHAWPEGQLTLEIECSGP